MNLYLVQHAEAAAGDVDPSRPITLRGKNDLLKVASFMRQAGVKPDSIWHSTELRAKQTAEIISKGLSREKIVEKNGLKPNDSVDKIFDEIKRDHKIVMIVGHLPFLQKLVSLLLTGAEDKELIEFKPGSVVFLELGKFGWQIAWMLIPEVI